MAIHIKYCSGNEVAGRLSERLNKWEENANVQWSEHGCLNYCGDCLTKPYVFIDKLMIIEDNVEILLQKIDLLLEANQKSELHV